MKSIVIISLGENATDENLSDFKKVIDNCPDDKQSVIITKYPVVATYLDIEDPEECNCCKGECAK